MMALVRAQHHNSICDKPKRRSLVAPCASAQARRITGAPFGGAAPTQPLLNPALHCQHAGSGKRRRGVIVHAEWFKEQADLWVELNTKDAFEQFIATPAPGKYKVIDFYAGWCASCKSTYPSLCKVAGDAKNKADFEFAKANIEVAEMKDMLQEMKLTGIPVVVVFNSAGKRLVNFTATFKTMEIVRKNLAVLAANKDAHVVVDPNGFVIVLDS